MNADQDLLMRQIKSFAQGLGAAMSKKDRRPDDPVVVFHDAEVSLASYQAKLITEVKENGFSAAKALLTTWRDTRLSRRQYEDLTAWLQGQRFVYKES